MSFEKLSFAFAVGIWLFFAMSCGTSSHQLQVATNPNIQLSPSAVTVQVQNTEQFTATVTNSSSQDVVWEVNNIVGGDTTVGTISSTGLYTAPNVPPSPANVVITAAVAADTGFSASATVTVTPAPPPITVAVAPKIISLEVATTQQFTATVSNASDTSVVWKVNGTVGGNSTVGTISTSGLYLAPGAVPGSNPVTVTAVSNANPGKSDSASVTVTPAPPPISVAVTPKTASLVVGQSKQFAASVSGTSNQVVTWSLSGTSCSGAGCGTIDSSGLYQAPATVPSPDATVTVTATSQADSSKSDTATVTVTVVPTPTVSLNPPANQSLVFNTPLTVSATLTNDPSNLGVTWSVQCVSDGESTPDCSIDPPLGDDDSDITVTATSSSAITLVSKFPDEGQDIVFNLTATSVATGSGGHGTATIQVHYHP